MIWISLVLSRVLLLVVNNRIYLMLTTRSSSACTIKMSLTNITQCLEAPVSIRHGLFRFHATSNLSQVRWQSIRLYPTKEVIPLCKAYMDISYQWMLFCLQLNWCHQLQIPCWLLCSDYDLLQRYPFDWAWKFYKDDTCGYGFNQNL